MATFADTTSEGWYRTLEAMERAGIDTGEYDFDAN